MKDYLFREPRLLISRSGEIFLNFITCAFYVLAPFCAFALFVFGNAVSEGLGVLLLLFLADRALHFGEAERTLIEVDQGDGNVALALTPRGYRYISRAFRKSLFHGDNFYLSLFRGLISQHGIKIAVRRLGRASGELLEKLDAYENDIPRSNPSSAGLRAGKRPREELLVHAEILMRGAFRSAQASGERYIEPRNIFAALFAAADPAARKYFEVINLSFEEAQAAIIFARWSGTLSWLKRIPVVLGGFAHRPRFLRHRIINRAWTSRPTPILDSYSTDLTDLAREEKTGFLIGHKKEYDTLVHVISRIGKPNALLVGEPGAGKSTIIAHLAFNITKDLVPPILFDKRLVSLDVGELIAEATPEILAGRLRKIVEEILLAQNIVLFIPDAHNLFRTAQAKGINAIDVLLPVIKSEAIPTICETYPREFKQYIEPRSDFLDQFQVVRVDEISEEEATRFLIYTALLLERQSGIFATLQAVRGAVTIGHRYFTQKLLPGSAVDLLKQAFAVARERKLDAVSYDIVAEIAEGQSKIPIQQAGEVETEKLLNLENIIHKRLVNQNAAVAAVSSALREYRSGLSRRGGPIATFLFVGPTGVGKTELAKILAEAQFGTRDAMKRFDMSEYQDKQSIFQFIGTPDGERTGALTDAILANPYSLVLLDEFEKAHPDILNLFLQVFDDGRLTDGLGRTVNFENTIIIATSNAHSEFIKTEVEKGRQIEAIGEELKKKLTDYFKPELLNRFSNVIVFRNLKLEEIYIVTGFLIDEVAGLLRDTHGIELQVEDTAQKKIAELGYSPVFGARPLRQMISEKIRGVLAEKILRKEVGRGDTLILSVSGEEFTWRKEARQ
ncbi:MAG: ATP-dependent Clp protease ATP-binding subunit [Candidatus Jorgensenbacteria bacterium]|nr:ATP-dependent Clp protease ATP-binding subunit [Candidatus Jorgensenbacteria bacterium]